MSLYNESIMSSAVSISGVDSLSGNGSTVSVGPDRTATPGVAGTSGSNLFDLGDGDMHIVTNGTKLETHKFLVKRFTGLKDRIKNDTITLDSGEPGADVFKSAFRILYASIVEGPFDFDCTTLTSGLLLATQYDYPALRAFAVDKLEKAELSTVDRIRLARKFDLPLWEELAYLELCERDEPLTMSEAGVLGLEAVVHVAKIREKEQRRKGRDVDATEELKIGGADGRSNRPGVVDVPATPVNAYSTAPIIVLPNSNKAKGSETDITDKDAGTILKPSFIDFPTPSIEESRSSYQYQYEARHRFEFEVPGCECSLPYEDNPNNVAVCQCKLPPCAVPAFKHLQTQQLAHKNNISALETTVERIQIAMLQAKLAAENTSECVPTPGRRPGSLQDDVRNWLGCEGCNNFKV